MHIWTLDRSLSYLDNGIPSASIAKLAARDNRRCFDNFEEPSRYPKFSIVNSKFSFSSHSICNWFNSQNMDIFFFTIEIGFGNNFFVYRTFSFNRFFFVLLLSSFFVCVFLFSFALLSSSSHNWHFFSGCIHYSKYLLDYKHSNIY